MCTVQKYDSKWRKRSNLVFLPSFPRCAEVWAGSAAFSWQPGCVSTLGLDQLGMETPQLHLGAQQSGELSW